MDPSDPQDDAELNVPEVLRSALKTWYDPVPSVPESIDQRILADARRDLALRAVPARPRRRTAWTVVAAVSTVIAASLLIFVSGPERNSGLTGRDFDGDGRIDILDAFAMARLLKSGKPQSRLDVNGDGRQDQSDVDVVARQAVML